MGCCFSTERSSHSGTGATSQPETAISPSSSTGPLGSATGYNATRPHDIYSPTSSRAPLTAPDSTSVPSSPGRSTHRRRSIAAQQSGTEGALSSHYNLPLAAPKAWKSTTKTWTTSGAVKERQDFFDTRVTGRREVWEALHQVSECIREGDIGTAQGILTAAGITLPTGRLEDGCYDERGELYRIPHIILRDPENLKRDAHDEANEDTVLEDDEHGKELSVEHPLQPAALTPTSEVDSLDKGKEAEDIDAVPVKCRLSNSGTDTTVMLGKTQPGGMIFSRLRQQVSKKQYSKLRIFYLGKELTEKETQTLEAFGWREPHVLNIFVVP